MQAGRDLDAIVAEKVMGIELVWAKNVPILHNGFIVDRKFEPCTEGTEGAERVLPSEVGYCFASFGEDSGIPPYSTSIEAAWQVVDELVKRGKVFIVKGDGLRTGDHNPKWTVLCDNQPRTDALTAPLAICLAALKAVGVEVP